VDKTLYGFIVILALLVLLLLFIETTVTREAPTIYINSTCHLVIAKARAMKWVYLLQNKPRKKYISTIFSTLREEW
jgi:hypothetical protein